MQIVINIDDDVYKRALVYKDVQLASNKANDLSELITAVANGTPLPKGHGKLKDVDVIINTLRDGYVRACIEEDVPTIIEAE